MTFWTKLVTSTKSVDDLAIFIQDNSIELYDFFISQPFERLSGYRADIEQYILPNFKVYRYLDFSDNRNRLFILCLLDLTERLGLMTEFQQLFHLADSNQLQIRSRLKASALFLLNVNTLSGYIRRIPDILDELRIAVENEEDSEMQIATTLINFYIQVFYNFGSSNLSGVHEFRDLLVTEVNTEVNATLQSDIFSEVVSYPLRDIVGLHLQIQRKLDESLRRSSLFLPFNIEPNLIEDGTVYVKLLGEVAASFEAIRQLCTNLYSHVASDAIFYSLQRGIRILSDYNQLIAYIHSYGKMHQAKLLSAYSSLGDNLFSKDLELVDWGCGQGLATVCFLEHFKEYVGNGTLYRVTLIEPSEIGLKRAALHIRKFNKSAEIITLNKDIDSLVNGDLKNESARVKVHFFSNILDVDLFAMSNLIEKIKANFRGINYFVCVSPYISVEKTQRIDDFVQSFTTMPEFRTLLLLTEMKGKWQDTTWSRVVRVFVVNQ